MTGKYTVAFGSVTIAMKAQTLLNHNGIRTSVVRTPKNLSSGCGYSLSGYGEVSMTASILERNGIKYKAVMETPE